jgi:hypothetical protein
MKYKDLDSLKHDLSEMIKEAVTCKNVHEVRITDNFDLWFILDEKGMHKGLCRVSSSFVNMPEEIFELLHPDNYNEKFYALVDEVLEGAGLNLMFFSVNLAKHRGEFDSDDYFFIDQDNTKDIDEMIDALEEYYEAEGFENYYENVLEDMTEDDIKAHYYKTFGEDVDIDTIDGEDNKLILQKNDETCNNIIKDGEKKDIRLTKDLNFNEEPEDLDELMLYHDYLDQFNILSNKSSDHKYGIFQIVGIQYEGRNNRVEALKVGDAIILEREFDNPYDKNAIHIRNLKGESLGHMESLIASFLSELLLKNWIEITEVTVHSITPLSKRSSQCKSALLSIKIEIKDNYHKK